MTTSLTFIASGGTRKQCDLAAFITADIQERAHLEANAWIKRLRLVRYGSQTMRERFMYRDESLWWFTELYLHRMRRLDRAVATVLALDLAIAGEGPARMVISGGDDTVAAVAQAVANARGLPIDIEHTVAAPSHTSHESRLIGVTARLSRWRLGRPITPLRATVAAFVHTAFWRASHGADRGGEEGYIGPVLDAVAERLPHEALALVGVGPRRNFRARRWWDPVANAGHAPASVTPIEKLAPMRSIASALAFWRERRVLADAIVSGDDIRAAAVFESCDLWEILSRDLRETALLQWPWSARAMDEAGAALDALQPAVAVTYAEAGGWGRALMIEARRRGIRSVGVQHGFIYRHWLNYQHEVDELQPVGRDRGAPIPDCTLLFDRYAEEGLTAHGHYPSDHLIVTGNARLDVLASRVHAMTTAERDAARRNAGGAPDRPFALLAAKFSEIRDVLAAFVRAVASEPTLQVASKAHPAETIRRYMRRSLTAQPTSRSSTRERISRRSIACADAQISQFP